MTSPTQQTLKALKKTGHRVQVVERWNFAAKRRIDLFGFIDIVALSPGNRTIGVQACVGGDVRKRAKKIAEECTEAAMDWLRCGNWIEVHGWRKLGPKGKRKVWKCRVLQASIFDGSIVFDEVPEC